MFSVKSPEKEKKMKFLFRLARAGHATIFTRYDNATTYETLKYENVSLSESKWSFDAICDMQKLFGFKTVLDCRN